MVGQQTSNLPRKHCEFKSRHPLHFKKDLKVTKAEFIKDVKLFFKAITFRNPCRYCITRPLCNDECGELGNHADTILYSIMLVLNFIIFGAAFTCFYLITEFPGIACGLMTYMVSIPIGVSYIVINHTIHVVTKEDYMLLFMYCFLLGYSCYLLDILKIDELVDVFVRRMLEGKC